MKTRMDLQKLLEETIGKRKDGVQNVYFQPPENLKMVYPCIRYSRDTINNEFADNLVYQQNNIYEIVVIDKDPDSEIVRRVSQLPMCTHDRHFKSDNLNHDVFTLCF